MLQERIMRRLGVLLCIAAICGCGGEGALSKPTAHLQGTVLIDGQPLPSDAQGTIDFHPAGSGQAQPTSATIVNGKYDAPNVPQGEVVAYFNIGRLTGRMISEAGGSPFPEMEQLTPTDAQQGLSIEVTGDATKNFDL